jgi:hypothetical protein
MDTAPTPERPTNMIGAWVALIIAGLILAMTVITREDPPPVQSPRIEIGEPLMYTETNP